MFYSQAASYTGKQFETGFIGQLDEQNIFFVLAVEDGMTQEVGTQTLQAFRDQVVAAKPNNLSSFERAMSEFILKNNLPAHVSLAAGVLVENILYVKTVGNGQIYYRRGNDFALLMDGDKSASGYVAEYDCVVFTTNAIKKVLGEVNDIKLFVDMNAPQDIVEKLKNEEYDEEEKGFASLFVEFTSQPSPVGVSNVSVPTDVLSPVATAQTPVPTDQATGHDAVMPPQIPAQDPFAATQSRKRDLLAGLNLKKSKKIALALSVVLFAVLIWSVVFGYQRRTAALLQKDIESTEQSIDLKLEKAKKESFLNLDTSLELITQAKEELDKLKKQIGDKKPDAIEKIQKTITDTEAQVVKKEDKATTEFYDLTLEEKSAKGSALYFDGKNLAILDTGNTTVYVLTLETKAIKKYTSSEVSGASHVALYNDNVFFFNQKKGIYQFTSESKAKNVVSPDSDWGKIVDFHIYNGNLYLLDTGRDQIDKYLVAEGGYSDAQSYLKSDSVDLGDAQGMAIDSSVYIAAGDRIKKFTRGAADDFKTDFPDKTRSLSGVYTDEDIEQVYTWDTTQGLLYVLDKEGSYARQLQSQTVAKADGIFVSGKSAYILVADKIYSLSLE